MKPVTIHKNKGFIKGKITLPASKSISNRALIINYLSGDKLQLNNLSPADDTQLMVTLLSRIEKQKGSEIPITIDCQNAGTVARFLTALLAITPGKWLITGSGRMKERPVGILVDCLNSMGGSIEYKGEDAFLPLLIEGKPLKGEEIEIDGSVSSQFISALLLISPEIQGGLSVKFKNKVNSLPYIEMTLKLLNRFGIKSSFGDKTIRINPQEFKPGALIIEPDWTSASYWYEIAAFADKTDIVLKGLQKESLQGDAILSAIFKQFGVRTEYLTDGIRLTKSGEIVSAFSIDFTHCPDLAQAVIVTCAGLNIPGKFTGLESLRIKETDRIKALVQRIK